MNISPIAARFGVYFLHGWCSCLRPFSENVRFGVPVFFPLGVPVVSRWCNGVPVVPRCVPVVSRWCPSGVAVVSQWCRSGVLVLFEWCPGGVPVMFLWCLGGVSVSQCWSGRVRCACVVPVVSWSFPGGVPVVSRWLVSQSQWCRVLLCVSVVSQCCSPIATRFGVYFLHGFMFVLASIFGECTIRCPSLFSSWCPGGVPVVSHWCPGGVPVVSRWCPSSGVSAV